jgi:uncharacterized protein (DUF58 family)
LIDNVAMLDQFISKLRKYEIQIRKAINADMRGNFRSVFRGSGLEYTDLREYQYGDDVRTIDWNTSAKGHGTFVKIFKEEKEQTVFFVVDVSGSQVVGGLGLAKIDVAKEICGVLSLSAIQEASHVGLLCFSDKKEKYVSPSNGMKQAYQIITELYRLKPESAATNLAEAAKLTLNILNRRSVVIVISDFIDTNYEQNFKALARKHDLVLIHLQDQLETTPPRLGIVPVLNPETGQTKWVNTSSPWFRASQRKKIEDMQYQLTEFSKRHDINYLTLDTKEDFVPALVRLFRIRKKY